MATPPLALTEALRDHYTIEHELGRGGMATVYLAHDQKHDRSVAVKVLHPDLASAIGQDRFLREIKLTARLDHPHILPVLDSGDASGLLWYVMPFVEGETLRDLLRRETQLPLEEAVKVAGEVADALDYAHRHGIIHRDIKPENILLSDSHARVADFGVARAIEAAGGEAITGTGFAVGTPAYMSPEQASTGQLDARSDVYSLGCVVYEMLAGEPPFTGPTPQAVIAKRFAGPAPPLRMTRPDLPAGIDRAVQKALAPAPAGRFRTAGEFAKALVEARTNQNVTAPYRPTSKRRTAMATAAGVITLLALGTFALMSRTRATPAALNSNLLAVAPFDVLDPKLQLWREGLVDILARNFDGAGPIRSVPPTTVIRRWAGRADQPSATQLARRTGARLVVFGSLIPAGGDSVRLLATLHDAQAGRSLVDLELRDAGARVDRLADSLTLRVLAELGRSRRIELTRVASLGSTSLPALKAFLQGEQWFRRTLWDSALASYERAVQLDTSFALAYWKLARVLGWQRIGNDSLSIEYALRAGRLNHGLAPRDSFLVAVDSLLESKRPWGWGWYKRLSGTALAAVNRYPDDTDAWHTLGEVRIHVGMRYGVGVAQALAAFDRAIALDSDYAPAYLHAIDIAAYVRGLEVSRRYAQEYLKRAPGDVTAGAIRLALDLADPARAHTPEVERALREASANTLFKAWTPLEGATDSAEAAVRVARALVARSTDSAAPWLPRWVRQAALIVTLSYRGHLREAAAEWNSDLTWSGYLLRELALLGAIPHDTAQAFFGRLLSTADLDMVVDGLGWWAARGDTGSIRRVHQLVKSKWQSSSDPALHEKGLYWTEAAQAYQALARRDTTEALQRFEELPDSLCDWCFAESLTRLLLRSARGKDRQVIEDDGPWYVWPTASTVIARLEQARAAERLGERDRAMRDYQFVADAWRHADPELQPYVSEARRALHALSGEPGS